MAHLYEYRILNPWKSSIQTLKPNRSIIFSKEPDTS